jgi:predicted outer membrane repeat protein
VSSAGKSGHRSWSIHVLALAVAGLSLLASACGGTDLGSRGVPDPSDEDAGSKAGRADAGQGGMSDSGGASDSGDVPVPPGNCASKRRSGCAEDGNAWRFDGCGEPVELVERCAERHGTCADGVCGCAPGWAGSECERCVVFASAAAPAGGDGTSWGSALISVPAAIEAAAGRIDPLTKIAQCEVWLTEGTYHPTDGTDPAATIQLRSGVHVYGGFSGRERVPDERVLDASATVLSGDIGEDGVVEDNSHHVVTSADDAGYAPLADGAEEADSRGAGIYAERVEVRLHDVTLRDNTAEAGAALYAHGSFVRFENVVFEKNTANERAPVYIDQGEISASGLTVSNNRSLNWLGGFYLKGTTGLLSGAQFTDNSGGEGGALRVENAVLTIEDATFERNVSYFQESRAGGGISAEHSDLTVSRSTFQENRAAAGGGIDATGGHLVVEESSFDSNHTTGAGAIAITNGELDVVRCGFSNHHVTDFASAIGVTSSNHGPSRARIDSSTFSDNYSEAGQGAVAIDQVTNTVITRCTFERNRSAYGGAVYVGRLRSEFGEAGIFESTFVENEATESGGGAVQVDGHAVIANSTFSNNRAAGRGGAILVTGKSEIANVSTEGNTAEQGGASVACGFGTVDMATCSIANSVLWDDAPLLLGEVPGNDKFGGQLDVSSCDVRGGFPGEGNISSDPLLEADLSPADGSPVIDGGDPTLIPKDTADLDQDGDLEEPLPFDLNGTPRIQRARPDMGAYEIP